MCYERRDPNVARACWERDQRGKKMAEYVERDFVLNGIDTVIVAAKGIAGDDPISNKTVSIIKNIRAFINSVPAADVAPVVLCEKCDFYGANGRCAKSGLYMDKSGFCSMGKMDGE